MEEGDMVMAIWSDGLCVSGKYRGFERGWIILLDKNGEKIVCDPNAVKFEKIKEEKKNG